MTRSWPGLRARFRDPRRSRGRSGPQAGRPGQRVAGHGFYVWDEDPAYARAWGAELDEARCRELPAGPSPEARGCAR